MYLRITEEVAERLRANPKLIEIVGAGPIGLKELEAICDDQSPLGARRKAAALRKARELNAGILELRAALANKSAAFAPALAALLQSLEASRDRLSRAIPSIELVLLDDVADMYEAEDVAKTSNVEPDCKPVHIHLPNEADPATAVEAVASALGDGVKG